MCLNHHEQVYNHPAHTKFPVQGGYALVWEGKQEVQGAYALVRGGSSTSNHFITEIARCGEF